MSTTDSEMLTPVGGPGRWRAYGGLAFNLARASAALLLPIVLSAIAAAAIHQSFLTLVRLCIAAFRTVISATNTGVDFVVRCANAVGGFVATFWPTLGWSWPTPVIRSAPEASTTVLDLGIGAFGAAMLLSTLKDAGKPVQDVIKHWSTGQTGILRDVQWPLFVAFLGFWFSLFGLKTLQQETASVMLGLNARSIYPQSLDVATGQLSFYVNFSTEAGRKTFDWEDERTNRTATLTERDAIFLRSLRRTLEACGTEDAPVKVSIAGFASSSTWDEAHADLLKMSGAGAAVAQACTITAGREPWLNPGGVFEQKDVQGMREALACMNAYVSGRPLENAEYAKAFNVYLANRRREEVRHVLIPANSAKVRLVGDAWQNAEQMSDAQALNDYVRGYTIGEIGLLTRSAMITIQNASRCTKEARVTSRTTELVLH